MSEDARGAWGGLAAKPPRAQLDLPGAEVLSESSHLDETEAGLMTWSAERVYRTRAGLYLLARLVRTTASDDEQVQVVAGATPESLVAEVRAGLGMTPGLVEVLGRAGIEIGLEPGDEEED
jgi:hypothetical protein